VLAILLARRVGGREVELRPSTSTAPTSPFASSHHAVTYRVPMTSIVAWSDLLSLAVSMYTTIACYNKVIPFVKRYLSMMSLICSYYLANLFLNTAMAVPIAILGLGLSRGGRPHLDRLTESTLGAAFRRSGGQRRAPKHPLCRLKLWRDRKGFWPGRLLLFLSVYFASFTGFRASGIRFLSAPLRCSSSSGCGSGLRGSIWLRIAVL